MSATSAVHRKARTVRQNRVARSPLCRQVGRVHLPVARTARPPAVGPDLDDHPATALRTEPGGLQTHPSRCRRGQITLGDLGAKRGILGGINAVIVGNYLTTLGRPAEADLELLDELQMPLKALNASL